MYELDRLGWVDFEELVQTLLISRLGLAVESWGGSGDWGRDAYCAVALKYPNNNLSKGPFLFQCKFVENANAAGARPEAHLVSAVKNECSRILQRKTKVWGKPPKHYALISNAPIRAAIRTKIEHQLREVLPTSEIHIHDGRDVSNWLNLMPEIIPRFPQIFTIRDLNEFLSQAVIKGIVKRSEVAIAMARQSAKVFVPTRAYYEALDRLAKHAFVVLEGPPEMGKTTIARLIALAQFTQGWEAIECKSPKEFHKTFERDRPQVFVADDFFGRTEYEPTRISKWQDELPYILERLNAEHWLIFTSRAHLLKMAKHDLDISGHNSRFPQLGEVVVNAGRLSEFEKARILYRHAKAANLQGPIKKSLKTQAATIVRHKKFTPLRIKNLIVSIAQTE